MTLRLLPLLLLLSACGSATEPRTDPPGTATQGPGPQPRNTPYRVESGRLVLPAAIRFQTGSPELDAESEPVLEFVRDWLTSRSDVTLVRIEVHTDSDGDDVGNQRLSEQRARTVARWLVDHRIDCKRLLPVGFGESKPVAPNDTPANKGRNRRTEFLPAMLRGRAIGGLPVDGGGVVAGDPCR